MSPVRGEAIPALLERQGKLRDEVKALKRELRAAADNLAEVHADKSRPLMLEIVALKRELAEALKDAAKWKRHAQALAQGKHLPEAP